MGDGSLYNDFWAGGSSVFRTMVPPVQAGGKRELQSAEHPDVGAYSFFFQFDFWVDCLHTYPLVYRGKSSLSVFNSSPPHIADPVMYRDAANV